MQQEQLKVLKDLSGVDFKFVPTNKNEFGIKYYEYQCNNAAEYWDITGKLNQYPEIVYRCIEHEDKNRPSVIVLENELDTTKYDNIIENKIIDPEMLKPIGKINGNDVFLEPILTIDNKCSTIVSAWGRAIAVVNINGRRLPFYVSSGASGKEHEYGIPSGKWYPLQGMTESWLNKMPNMLNNPYPELNQVCDSLEHKFPAAKMKQDAAKNLLPFANHESLLKNANFDFPEGASITEYTNEIYVKNHCIYLPQIIAAWRSEPNDFFNVSNGVLASTGQKILNKVQKMGLFCGSKLKGDYIWFYPIEDNEYEYVKYNKVDTDDGIRAALWNIGINSAYTTTQNERGFGIPVYVFVEYFEQQKRKEFEKGLEKLTKNHGAGPKENTIPSSILKKITEFFKD